MIDAHNQLIFDNLKIANNLWSNLLSTEGQQIYQMKSNPQISFHTLDVSDIYRYSKGQNIPWSVTEYRTPKTEINAQQQRNKRKSLSERIAQNKLKYVTRRGFYMDHALKVAKSLPSTHTHGQQKEWDFSQQKKRGGFNKVNPKLIKNTYLDQIESQQKKRKIPGVCTYKLQKSLKQKLQEQTKMKKPDQKVPEKIYFHQDIQALSNTVPGVGAYNPRHISPRQRTNKLDYKFWTKKHRIQTQVLIKRQSVKPAPGSHSPMNTTLMTFDQLAQQLKKSTKKKGFATDARFEYTRENKRKSIEVRPDPTAHSQLYEWRGKSISPKKTQWNQMLWKGHSKTIYH